MIGELICFTIDLKYNSVHKSKNLLISYIFVLSTMKHRRSETDVGVSYVNGTRQSYERRLVISAPGLCRPLCENDSCKIPSDSATTECSSLNRGHQGRLHPTRQDGGRVVSDTEQGNQVDLLRQQTNPGAVRGTRLEVRRPGSCFARSTSTRRCKFATTGWALSTA